MCCVTVLVGRCYACKGPVSVHGSSEDLVMITTLCTGNNPLGSGSSPSADTALVCKGRKIERNVACRGVGENLCQACRSAYDGSRGLFPDLYWGLVNWKGPRSWSRFTADASRRLLRNPSQAGLALWIAAMEYLEDVPSIFPDAHIPAYCAN